MTIEQETDLKILIKIKILQPVKREKIALLLVSEETTDLTILTERLILG